MLLCFYLLTEYPGANKNRRIVGAELCQSCPTPEGHFLKSLSGDSLTFHCQGEKRWQTQVKRGVAC